MKFQEIFKIENFLKQDFLRVQKRFTEIFSPSSEKYFFSAGQIHKARERFFWKKTKFFQPLGCFFLRGSK